jgi:hypothetical protein
MRKPDTASASAPPKLIPKLALLIFLTRPSMSPRDYSDFRQTDYYKAEPLSMSGLAH